MNWRLVVGAAALMLGIAGCSDGDETGTEPLRCEGEMILCDGACSDTSSDWRNCGGCGIVCGDNEICSEGSCALVCPQGQQACDGACVTLETSAQHCGACGNACAAGEVCSGGTCAATCPEGQTACDGGCFDTATDRAHCGGCGNACGAGEACVGGTCEPTCPAGQELCDGLCIDTNASVAHCGGCGNVCAAGEVCVEGACRTDCTGGLTACDGACRNTDTDPRHCGACGNACGDGAICVDGSCQPFCAGGLTSCDGACRDTNNDPNHCGACGNTCAATEICSAGACVPSCGGYASDHCETGCTNFDTDPLNCGGCGITCADGEVCSEGVCSGVCAPTLTECEEGACTSLQDDPANCGACGNTCTAAPGAIPVCADGDCAATCAPGLADCNGDLLAAGSDGCEVTLATDLDNCGACGLTCSAPPNATRACVQGACTIGACQTGFENCDGDDFNGCEVDTSSDDANCGGCGLACDPDQFCSGGTCHDMVDADSCLAAPMLQAGTNTFRWFAQGRDHITVRPCTTGNPTGPDLVFQYTPTYNGQARIEFNNTFRAYAVVTQGTCDDLTEPVTCESVVTRVTPTFPVTANTTYFIHLVDSDSGTGVLPNPLTVTVTELDCATLAPTATAFSPDNGATNPTLTGTFQVTFSNDVDTTKGSFTVTGNRGTNRTLAVNDPAVTWSSNRRTATIALGLLPSGEVIDISWSGLEDAVCGKPIPARAWTVTNPVPACEPGVGGVVGATISRLPVPFMPGSTLTDEQYVVADADPNGWVYVGGTSSLHRVSKNGGMAETLSGTGTGAITSSHLGYHLAFAGQNLVSLENRSSASTTGYIFRLSADGGRTFAPEDAVTFPYPPGDTNSLYVAPSGLAAWGNEVFIISYAGPGLTEIWSADLSGSIPAMANLLGTFAGDTEEFQFCDGLAADARYLYTTCRHGPPNSPNAIVAFDRTTGAVKMVADVGDYADLLYDKITAADLDGDGIADVLYKKTEDPNAKFVCAPHGTSFVDELLRWEAGTGGSIGLAWDPSVGALWFYDDKRAELIKVQ